MATISKRGAGYRIKVSLGYDMNGKQIIKSTTFSHRWVLVKRKLGSLLRNMHLILKGIAEVLHS